MKKHHGIRLLSLLPVSVVLLGPVPAIATPVTKAATNEEIATQTAKLPPIPMAPEQFMA